jgi:hypothetical protein
MVLGSEAIGALPLAAFPLWAGVPAPSLVDLVIPGSGVPRLFKDTRLMPVITRSNTKAPTEFRNVSYDFAAELAGGETITGQTVAIFYNTVPPTLAAGGSDMIASGVTLLQNTLVTCVLVGGVFGQDYLVTFTATTSAGQIIPRSIYQLVGQT